MKIRVEGDCAVVVSEVEDTVRRLGYDPVATTDSSAALGAYVSMGEPVLPASLAGGPLLVITDRNDPASIRRLLLAGVSDWLLWPRDRELLGERLSVLRRRLGAGTIIATSLAHEISNPLTWVLANLEHALSSLPPDDVTLGSPIRDALLGVEQIQAILQGLRSYTQHSKDALTGVELGPVLEGVVRMLGDGLRRSATLHCEWTALPTVLIHEAELRQVLLNLITNALQAFPDRPREENRVGIVSRAHPEGIAIEITDNGVGIDPRILPRIFDPFFTTKRASQGTGLGLSISTRMVMAMGGRIEAESEQGVGTTFRVILRTADLPRARTRSRILLLEDEPLVVSLLQRLLSDRYDIESTPDAVEALSWLEAGKHFDVILSDLMLPGMDGMEFFQRLVEDHPSLVPRTGFITGGAFTDQARHFLADHDTRLLEKPFTAASLRNFVQSLEAP